MDKIQKPINPKGLFLACLQAKENTDGIFCMKMSPSLFQWNLCLFPKLKRLITLKEEEDQAITEGTGLQRLLYL
jgi:hypothetical protein